MQPFSQTLFNQFILAHKVIGFFENPVTLKSGRQSYWYVNWRTVVEDVYLLEVLSNFVMSFVTSIVDDFKARKIIQDNPQSYYGVPEGASKLALLTQYLWACQDPHYGVGTHTMAMGRGKAKEHGVAKDKYFLGVPKGPTVVLEDVTTTGGSLISTIEKLKEAEVSVTLAIGLTNRMERRDDGQTVEEAISKISVNGRPLSYVHMSNARELIPLALEQLKPPKHTMDAVRKEIGLK